jgi:hypothetical protein
MTLVAVGGVSASAQPIPDGQLVGTVRDATGAVLVGVAIAASSPQMIGGPRQTTTDARGFWRVPGVPAGSYQVRVSAPGFRPALREQVQLVAGSTLTVDFTLEVAGISEIHSVAALAPIFDVTSAAVPSGLGQVFLLDLPTSGTVADLINLAPGVAGDMAYGGTKLSNGIYVDGVDTTEPSEGNPLLRYAVNWLEDAQIVGLGADAEHGNSTGVTARAIVRSGTNTFAGLGEYWTTRGGWVANNTRELSASLQSTFESERIASYWSANAQLGGPLRPNRLWFFAGLDHAIDERSPAGYAGPDRRETHDTRGIAKLTATAWWGGRLEGFIQGGHEDVANARLAANVAPEAAGRSRSPQLSWSARALSHLGRSVLLDVRYTGYDSVSANEPQPPQSVAGPPAHWDMMTDQYTGNLLGPDRDDISRQALSATSTWYAHHFLGRDHELNFGGEIDWADYRYSQWYTGGQAYFDFGGEPDTVYLWEGGTSTSRTFHEAAFAQDRVTLFGRATFLPGIRVDAFRTSTPGAAQAFTTTAVSPRLGVAWDVQADHRAVVRLHYGRYTDPAFAQAYMLADTSQSKEQIIAHVVAPGVFEEIARSGPVSRQIDPNLRQSYVDEFVAGGERQLFANTSVQIQYIHRRFERFMSYIREGAVWTPVQRRDPGPDGRLGTADDGQVFTAYSLSNLAETTRFYTNPDDQWRRYQAVQVVARTRQANRWQVQASYTWSRSTGTVGNQYHANSGVRATGAGDPNALINGDARVVHDPTNEAKLVGVWTPAWLGGFTVSGVYRYMTGSAWGRTFTATGLGQGSATILAESRGTRRVAAINNVDLRVGKTFPAGSRRRLAVFADVFNLTNQGVPDSDWATPVITASGSMLGVPLYWRQPRRVRVAVRVVF